MPPREPSRTPRAAALLLAAAVLVYLLYPVERGVAGAGILRPVYEHNAIVHVPFQGAVVTRLDIQYLQRVEAGTPLFTYLGNWHWSRLVITSGGPPREGPREPNPIDERRVAQQMASNAWCGRVLVAKAPPWEHRLCGDWGRRLYARNEIEQYEQHVQANDQAGNARLNDVRTFDEAKGEYVPTTSGEPFPSPFTGTVVALWIAPGMQMSPTIPLLEVLPDETPIEVLGLVPAAARPRLVGRKPQGTVRAYDKPIASRITAVTDVELGGATLQPPEIALLFPGVPADGPSVVTRVHLMADAVPADVGRIVRFHLGAGWRPRIWTWFSDR